MSSVLPPEGTFGDQLLCPICCELFEGRIILCSEGHSFCERCVLKIEENVQLDSVCPQCRSELSTSRNYIVEEMVKQLRQVNDAANAGATDVATSQAITSMIKTIPVVGDLINFFTSPSASTGISRHTAITKSLHRRGFFSCRMLNCNEKLPICRMINHVRTFHKDNLTELRLGSEDRDFRISYTTKCRNFRQCIRISQYGLFFLIVNVQQYGIHSIITAWVQYVGRNPESTRFKYGLYMHIGNDIRLFYMGFAHVEMTEASYIETKKQCLYHKTLQPIQSFDILINVDIEKKTGEGSVRHRNHTVFMHFDD